MMAGNMYDLEIEKAEYFPAPPSFWKEMKHDLFPSDFMRSWFHNGLYVIASVAMIDGREWLHVSFSRKSHAPSYEDIRMVRDHFIGEERKSVMVFPSKEHYVNIHSYCLHLWSSSDVGLPDFEVDIPGFGNAI